jgi:putative transposase
VEEKRKMIRKGHPKLSIAQQCILLAIHRSGVYYKPKGESALNLELMRLMDEHYLHQPFKSAKRMWKWLKRKGYRVNLKRVERLYYKVMGLRSIMPGKHTSRRCKEHKVYRYLLRELKIDRPNQVWATDITYIPMRKGFMYLTAVIDVHSRYVLNWSISNSMDADWVSKVMKETIDQYGGPEIINTDQGSQYTSDQFTGLVLGDQYKIRLSMDGKGRATDNAFIETLWKTIKYEKIYPNPPEDGLELYRMVQEHFNYYNNEREHSSIGDQYPIEVYKQAA